MNKFEMSEAEHRIKVGSVMSQLPEDGAKFAEKTVQLTEKQKKDTRTLAVFYWAGVASIVISLVWGVSANSFI